MRVWRWWRRTPPPQQMCGGYPHQQHSPRQPQHKPAPTDSAAYALHVPRAALPTVLAGAWLGIALVSVLTALCQYLRLEHGFAPRISHSGDGAVYANLRQRHQSLVL